MPRRNNQPNPEWVSAPYEVAGWSNIKGLSDAIESALKLINAEHGVSLNVLVWPDDLPGFIRWKITQVD